MHIGDYDRDIYTPAENHPHHATFTRPDCKLSTFYITFHSKSDLETYQSTLASLHKSISKTRSNACDKLGDWARKYPTAGPLLDAYRKK